MKRVLVFIIDGVLYVVARFFMLLGAMIIFAFVAPYWIWEKISGSFKRDGN